MLNRIAIVVLFFLTTIASANYLGFLDGDKAERLILCKKDKSFELRKCPLDLKFTDNLCDEKKCTKVTSVDESAFWEEFDTGKYPKKSSSLDVIEEVLQITTSEEETKRLKVWQTNLKLALELEKNIEKKNLAGPYGVKSAEYEKLRPIFAKQEKRDAEAIAKKKAEDAREEQARVERERIKKAEAARKSACFAACQKTWRTCTDNCQALRTTHKWTVTDTYQSVIGACLSKCATAVERCENGC